MTFDQFTELLVQTRDLRQSVGEAMAYNKMGELAIARRRGLDAVRIFEGIIENTDKRDPRRSMVLKAIGRVRYLTGDVSDEPTLSSENAYEAGRGELVAPKKKAKRKKTSTSTPTPPSKPKPPKKKKAKRKKTAAQKRAEMIRRKYSK